MQRDQFINADGQSIATYAWEADAPKALVVIAHGIGEHAGRYAHLAAALNAAGYSVAALDHRGHGHSAGERAYFESFDQPVADLKQFIDRQRAAHPGLPIFLYGHSMGSLISTLFALRHQGDLAGLISSGSPLLIESALPKPAAMLVHALAKIAPKLPFIAVDAATISRDPAVVAAYQADPLVWHRPAALGMISRLARSANEARPALAALRLPLLIVHGEADRLTPPAGSQALYQGASSADKTLKYYPDARHEVHNEPEQAELFAELIAWLDARAGG